MSRRSKRKQVRENFRLGFGEIMGVRDEDFGMEEETEIEIENDKIGKKCLCGAGERYEVCICYLKNKARRKELESKLGKEKFLKKQLVDELTQILIECDC
jgi:hypothetical protein